MAVLMDEDQAPEAVAETDSRPRGTRRRYIGRTAKWLAGILAAIIVLIAAAAVVLNTPVGERFLADRITHAGVAAERVATMPTLPPDSANRISVMPIPIADMPDRPTILAVFSVSFALG